MSLLTTYRKCARCGNNEPHLARGLCEHCYHAALNCGELEKYPRIKYGDGDEVESLPTRPKWSYENEAGEAELALAALKIALSVNNHLTEDQKKSIVAAKTEKDIADIVATAQQKRRQFYVDQDGFLHRAEHG